MTVGDRIKDRRNKIGMTVEDLASKVGISKSTLYRHENGFIEKVDSAKLIPIADALFTTPAVLMGWEDESEQKEPEIIQPKRIPFIVSASGGNPVFSENTYIYGTGVPHRASYAIRMIGDSMEPTFLDGDVIYIKEGTQIKDGSIAAVIINEEVTLRRLYNQKDGLLLVCDNPECRPFFAASNSYDVVKIIGKPIGFRRMFAEDD